MSLGTVGAPKGAGPGHGLTCVGCRDRGKKTELETCGLALFGYASPDNKKCDIRHAPWTVRDIPWIKATGAGKLTRLEITWPREPKEGGAVWGGAVCQKCLDKVITPKGAGKPLARTAGGAANIIEAARWHYRTNNGGSGSAPPTAYHCVGTDGGWVLPGDASYAHGPVMKPDGNWGKPPAAGKSWRMESTGAGCGWHQHTCAGSQMHPSDPACRKLPPATAAPTASAPTASAPTASAPTASAPTAVVAAGMGEGATAAAAADAGAAARQIEPAVQEGPATHEQAAAILRNQVAQKQRDVAQKQRDEEAARERKIILDQNRAILELMQGMCTPEPALAAAGGGAVLRLANGVPGQEESPEEGDKPEEEQSACSCAISRRP